MTSPMLKEIFAEQVKLDNKKRKEDIAKHRDKEVEQLKQSLNGITTRLFYLLLFKVKVLNETNFFFNRELKQSVLFLQTAVNIQI